MAYVSMVVPELTPSLVQAGASLLKALDAASVPVTAAFWLYPDDETCWELILASPEVAQAGSREFYGKLYDYVLALGDPELRLFHIKAMRPDEPTVLALQHALGPVPGIQKIRFPRNAANGVFIRDALVYRLP